MKLTKSEQFFEKYAPEFMSEFKHLFYGGGLSFKNDCLENRFTADYEHCFVGTVLERAGLDNKNYYQPDDKYECKRCKYFANEMVEVVDDIECYNDEDGNGNKDIIVRDYRRLMQRFAAHLRRGHKVEN